MKKQLLGLFTIISVGAFAQVPNSGVETWGSNFGAPQEPQSYVTENVFASPFVSTSNPTSVTQITGGAQYAGNVSAKIKTVKVVSNPAPTYIPDTVGVMMVGTVSLSGQILRSGTPWTVRLGALEFQYQYFPANNDNGAVASYLTKWNGLTRDTLAAAYFPFTTMINAWTPGSAPYVYDGAFPGTALPDSIHIYFLSSARPWLTAFPAYAQIGSELWIDAIYANPVGLNELLPITANDIIAYPNPATSVINFSTNNEKASFVELYDVTGKLVSTQKFDTKNIKIETSSLSEGVYLYTAKDAEGKILKSGKVSVSK